MAVRKIGNVIEVHPLKRGMSQEFAAEAFIVCSTETAAP